MQIHTLLPILLLASVAHATIVPGAQVPSTVNKTTSVPGKPTVASTVASTVDTYTLTEACSTVLGSKEFLHAVSCNGERLPNPTSSRDAFLTELGAYCDVPCDAAAIDTQIDRVLKGCGGKEAVRDPAHPAHRPFLDLFRATPLRDGICAKAPSTGLWCVAPAQRPSVGYYSAEASELGCGECAHAVRQTYAEWKEKKGSIMDDKALDRKMIQETVRCSDHYDHVTNLDSWIAQAASTVKRSAASISWEVPKTRTLAIATGLITLIAGAGAMAP